MFSSFCCPSVMETRSAPTASRLCAGKASWAATTLWPNMETAWTSSSTRTARSSASTAAGGPFPTATRARVPPHLLMQSHLHPLLHPCQASSAGPARHIHTHPHTLQTHPHTHTACLQQNTKGQTTPNSTACHVIVQTHTHTNTLTNTHTHTLFQYIPQVYAVKPFTGCLAFSTPSLHTHTHTHTHTKWGPWWRRGGQESAAPAACSNSAQLQL